MTTLREVIYGFPRKGGGRYKAMDPAVHARELKIREDIANAKSKEKEDRG